MSVISPSVVEKSMEPGLLEMREEELSTMKVRVVVCVPWVLRAHCLSSPDAGEVCAEFVGQG